MLTVDQHDLIRRKHLVDGMSQRAVAQELGHARNTVATSRNNVICIGVTRYAGNRRVCTDVN